MEVTASQISFYLGPSFYFMHIKLFITLDRENYSISFDV